MKHTLLLAALALWLPSTPHADPTHLDIMAPNIKDTDLRGPVKSVELKIWEDLDNAYTTEKREYDTSGNLLKITVRDMEGKELTTTTYFYDDAGCYTRQFYKNEDKGFENDWKVVLNPETRQIALREKDGWVGLETYSPEGFIVNYRLVDDNHRQVRAFEY